LEAGVGSGGLTTALLRAVGPDGSVHSIERREDFAEVARENVETYFGAEHPAWDLSVGDFQDVAPGLAATGPAADRVVLDMLAPWECIEAAGQVLVSGGVLLAYVATVTQLSRTAEALRDHGEFTEPYAWESFVRPWHLEGLAVRPEHRMNAHTGFLITSRRAAHGTTALTRATRPAPGSRDAAELGHPDNDGFGGTDTDWEAEDLGERPVTPRKIKRALRDIRQGRASWRARGRSLTMKTYAEMSTELEKLAAHNARLTAGLRAALDQIVDLKGELQRVADPPNSYTTYLRRAEGTTVDVLNNGRRLRVE